ncbi:MAG: nucleotidyltransferase domain-containing protein [Proteiniphilum sp.]
MKKTREYVLQAIREEVQKSAPGAMTVLFGSRARGDFGDESDWDVLVLLDKERLESSDYDRVSYPLYELGWKLDEKISPKLYTFSDWLKRSFTPFYKDVEEEGIIL